MGIFDTLKKYKWIVPLITSADREVKRTILKNLRKKKEYFYPQGEYNADIKNLINCMLCPNMCRFDCGTLQASHSEAMSPAYKARIGYYLSIGEIDPKDPDNKEFIDLMYQCTNEENCKVWCPFEFSVVSLLETVRDDLNEKGLMPDYCQTQINKLEKTGTIEEENIFLTYKEKGIENIETDGNDEVFYFVGCEMMKFPEVVKSNINLLKKANVKFSTNLEEKVCCGAPAFNIKHKNTINYFIEKNKNLVEKTGADLIVSDCPGCVDTLKNRYKKKGVELKPKIIHIIDYFAELIQEGKLKITKKVPDVFKKVTIHDPCLLARNLNDTSSIRSILQNIPGLNIIEPIYNKESTHCCGWSGTAHWANKDLSIKEARNRINELKETNANIIVSACPTCELGLSYGITEEEKESLKIIDLSELLQKVI
ncbi:MAG: (Fe-S)-binding protein [Candidatus Lokiarchaeota archaeon]